MYHINDLNHIINRARMRKRAFKKWGRMSVRSSRTTAGQRRCHTIKNKQWQQWKTDTAARSELLQKWCRWFWNAPTHSQKKNFFFTPFNIDAGEITLIPFQADSNWPFNRFGFGVGVRVMVKVKVMLRTCLMHFHARCMYKAKGKVYRS